MDQLKLRWQYCTVLVRSIRLISHRTSRTNSDHTTPVVRELRTGHQLTLDDGLESFETISFDDWFIESSDEDEDATDDWDLSNSHPSRQVHDGKSTYK